MDAHEICSELANDVQRGHSSFTIPSSEVIHHLDELTMKDFTEGMHSNELQQNILLGDITKCELLMRKSALIHIQSVVERVDIVIFDEKFNFGTTLAVLGRQFATNLVSKFVFL